MQKEQEKFAESSILEGMTSIRALFKAIEEKNPTNDRRISKICIIAKSFRHKIPPFVFFSTRAANLTFLWSRQTKKR